MQKSKSLHIQSTRIVYMPIICDHIRRQKTCNSQLSSIDLPNHKLLIHTHFMQFIGIIYALKQCLISKKYVTFRNSRTPPMIYFQVQHKISEGAEPSAAEARSNEERKTLRNYKKCVFLSFFGKKASKVEAGISILGMRGKRESTGRRPNSLLMSAEASKECQ